MHQVGKRMAAWVGTVAVAMAFGMAARAQAPAGAPAEAHWPQWRGPTMTGAAAEGADPAIDWGEGKNVRWKVRLPGTGTSTPIVWGDKVFIQVARPAAGAADAGGPTGPAGRTLPVLAEDPRPPRRGGGGGGGGGRGGFGGGGRPDQPYAFVLLCLDRRTGQTLWQKTLRQEVPHEGHHRDHGFSSYSPATDGKHVIAFFGSRGLHCLDMAGNVVWQKDLGRMRTRNSFGEGSSPALFGDVVVVNWDHEGDDFIAAFDKNTGDELWRQPRDEISSWSTPLVMVHDGKPQVIVSATGKVRSYDLKTGKQLWEVGGMTQNVIPSPVPGDGVVYLTSGFRGSALLAVKLGREGDLTGTDAIVWSARRGTPYVPSPLLYQGRLYVFSGNSGSLSIFEAKTGRRLVETQRVDDLENVYASPVGAAGRIYMTGRDGTTVVLKASDKIEVLAVNRLDEGIDASPAVAGKDILLRGKQHLYCIGQ